MLTRGRVVLIVRCASVATPSAASANRTDNTCCTVQTARSLTIAGAPSSHALSGRTSTGRGPMTLAIGWPHVAGESASCWPHEAAHRHATLTLLPAAGFPAAYHRLARA